MGLKRALKIYFHHFFFKSELLVKTEYFVRFLITIFVDGKEGSQLDATITVY
jgi:hypothetical protein